MNSRSFASKCCIAAAVVGLGLSSSALLVRADDMKMEMSKEDLAKTAEAQKKAVDGLKEHFDDATFVTIASMGNTDEIKASEAISATTGNDDVKKFAQEMIDDHTKAGDEMKELAKKKGFHVSDTPDAKHIEAMEAMKKLESKEADKSYAVAAVKDHEDTIALFKLAAENATDNDLKDFVKKQIPAFEHHLSMAKKLENKTMAMGS